MADLRDMELLAALARHKHFARAAAECGISQPAFSARIRKLELDLGAPIVNRGNRFQGFTQEGEVVLRWARRMIADARGLRQEIAEARGALSARLVIGSVPTALTYVARIAAALRARHPTIAVQILSHSSAEIAQGIETFDLDAGVTYLEGAMPAASRAELLYEERYVLLAPRALLGAAMTDAAITWADAAALPLCLLTRNMMNRRIIDQAFAEVGARPNLVVETNAFTAAFVQIASGTAATIAPDVLVANLGLPEGVVALGLVSPEVAKPIGLVTADREPGLPAIKALRAAVAAAPPVPRAAPHHNAD